MNLDSSQNCYLQVTDLGPVHAGSVVTLEIAEEIGAGSGSVCAEGHVVLVGAISTIVLAVAHVIP